MKCISINEINKFNYHDAGIYVFTIDDDKMIWETSGICITTDNSQNNEKYDTISEDMILYFYDFEITQIIKYGSQICNSNNVIISETLNESLTPEYYQQILLSMKNASRLELLYGGYEDDGSFCFEINVDNHDMYCVSLRYSTFKAEWEYTTDKAWYVDEPKRDYQVPQNILDEFKFLFRTNEKE